jgi:bifunctional DNA-binding transcriptional regulator/antitoxin component of YhaV-PrlF toxin-antitoxin module
VTNIEYRKLGGAGIGHGSLNLPAKFLEQLKWKAGEYIVIQLDEFHQQLILRKAKDH